MPRLTLRKKFLFALVPTTGSTRAGWTHSPAETRGEIEVLDVTGFASTDIHRAEDALDIGGV